MPNNDSPIDKLRERLAAVRALQDASAVLYWDMATYLPEAGHAERGAQMGRLSEMAHEMFTAEATATLLERARAEAGDDPLTADLLRVTQRDLDRARCLPGAFVSESTAHYAHLHGVWAKARATADFAAVQSGLETSLDLARQESAYLDAEAAHIMDPLIAQSDYGFSAENVRSVFADLRRQLTPMVEAVCAAPAPDDACIRQSFPKDKQLAFGEEIAVCLGYDLQRGRQDLTHHPFMIRLGVNDVRITTRADEHFLPEALFSTWHETGHALYEMGIDPALGGTPLLDGASMAVHESQSRLWENLVCRSRPFWDWAYPKLQLAFPDQLGHVPQDVYYRAINRVERSLIRVEADELTYNLHVMIRFDLECDLLTGALSIADLPAAWHARYESDLGLRAPDDKDGVMQDVHWYGGRIGGHFQGYTLGNIMSAQFYQAALAAEPVIAEQIPAGDFSTLRGWLTENLYQHGRRQDPLDLLTGATGSALDAAPYIRYLTDKFTALYSL